MAQQKSNIKDSMDLTNISKYGITDDEWESYIKTVNDWVIRQAKGITNISDIDEIPIVHMINEKVKSYEDVYGKDERH